MDSPTLRHVYGPVPSRRLGRSLGVDLVPFKTCSYDCVYCQLGRTTVRTLSRQEHVPVDEVLEELAGKLRKGPPPDAIGLAGSGEPTLHSRMGDLIAGIKRLTRIPVAVLTNGSLLWMPEVRVALADADLVLPSLDAGSPESFARINRPHPDISFERMVEGLIAFSLGYKGRTWLEVFVLAGRVNPKEEIARIAAITERMRLERVQLNTVSRPPADASAVAVSATILNGLRKHFSGPCEVIAEVLPPLPDSAEPSPSVEGILALLRRRPCTVEGLARGLGLPPNEVLKLLEPLCARKALRTERRADALFYRVADL